MARAIILLALGAMTLSACQHGRAGAGESLAAQEVDPPVFAQALCAGCHAIKPLQLSPNPQAPSFSEIVNRPGVNRTSLHRFLTDAHNYPEVMDFDLEPQHVDELTDYMITLKDPHFRRTPY